jgi:hypothetical protein
VLKRAISTLVLGVGRFMLFRIIYFLFLAVLPCSQAWSAPTQQRFNDWLVTCNNQNFWYAVQIHSYSSNQCS